MLTYGVDLSLTSTAVVAVRRTKVVVRKLITTTKDATRPYDDQGRQEWLVNGLLQALPENEPYRVFIEDHAFGTIHSDTRVHELGGIVKRELWLREVDFELVPVGTLKLFATGSGRASKEQMMEAAEADGFDLPRAPRGGWGAGADDLADAYWLAKRGVIRGVA